MREFLIFRSLWNYIKQAFPHCVICVRTDAQLPSFALVPYCPNSWNCSCLKAFQATNLFFFLICPKLSGLARENIPNLKTKNISMRKTRQHHLGSSHTSPGTSPPAPRLPQGLTFQIVPESSSKF